MSAIPNQPSVASTPRHAMDAALDDLARARGRWSALDVTDKVGLLDQILRDLRAVAPEWARACAVAKGVGPESAAAAEEWALVAYLLRGVAVLRRSLAEIAVSGRPRIPGPIRPRGKDQVGVQVFPQSLYDRLFFPGMTLEIWTEPGVGEEEVRAGQAALYRGPSPEGRTVLVLGAGNISTLGPWDILDKLFCEGHVVIYKTHPVTDYLTPLIERSFSALTEGGFLRVVRGGAEEGEYLANHPLVDELHLTGSDRTYDAVVFGPGPAGKERKERGERRVTKRFTCELGCVSPVIVVPGPWRAEDIVYQARNLAAMQVVNTGFNCVSTRVILQYARWEHRRALLGELTDVLARTPTRPAYYPGAHSIHRRFVEAHPDALLLGEGDAARLPWTLIPGVDPAHTDDICFTTEGFCSQTAEAALDAPDAPSFLDSAVRFANERLWGTLSCTLLVHPASLKDPAMAQAVERAIRDLRYGTVGVNLWGALNLITSVGSWGAFPGHPYSDIQSGQGTVRNYLMIPKPQKTVMRGPFRQWPMPILFPGHQRALHVARRLPDFEAAPSPLKFPAIMWAAMRG